MNKDTPAFPAVAGEHGMSLRDWYAGMALQGILANANNSIQKIDHESLGLLAAVTYQLADAMLAQREGE